jgi:hypothetical protein
VEHDGSASPDLDVVQSFMMGALKGHIEVAHDVS